MMSDETGAMTDAVERRRQLLDKFASTPPTEVVGVVAPGGMSAGRSRGEELWTLHFSFHVWRSSTGELQRQPLTFRRAVADEEFRLLQPQTPSYAVIRVRARVVADVRFGLPQAELEAILGPETDDAELNEEAARFKEPVTLQDPTFGTLTLVREVDWYTCKSVWDSKPVELNVSATEAPELKQALAVAHALWDAMPEWNRRIRDFAVKELLDLKNGNWLEDGEDPLTPDAFQSKMAIESITVYPDGSFDFLHADGDLFWGHAIQVRGSLAEGPTSADIPG